VTQDASQQFPIGCSLDVVPEVESYCSGRRRCDVKIDDDAFPRQTTCHRALKVHLWIQYRCIKGRPARYVFQPVFYKIFGRDKKK